MITAINHIVKNVQDRLFDSVVSNRLIYNTCWEDPRLDRQLLQMNRDSQVVMLTSAGCNALEYLLDNPASIDCVDVNPAQNALLNFKKALFQHGDYKLLWNFFGRGYHKKAAIVYRQKLADLLPEEAQNFWDTHINYFSQTAGEPSFYYRGTSGKVALMMHQMIRRKGLYSNVLNLLDSQSLAEQKYYFEEIDPNIWSSFYKWLLKRDTTMAMLGVPKTQRNMIESEFKGGLLPFVRSSLRHVFTQIPIRDNYFWRVYLTGSYTPNCSPGYLKREYFDFLQSKMPAISTHTQQLTRFLEQNPGSYSHFILLDHMDWMANTKPGMLAMEWELILKNARPGARILFRSAGKTNNFLPDFVFDYVNFNHKELTHKLHQKDRVGTYGSTHLGIVA
ncbi:MAG: BtaA family protein [Balneolaceae bacterium]|nr:BtaA family protein [Balneolaceae bacterium]